MQVRITGRDPGAGIQLSTGTYMPGDVVEVTEAWARLLISTGRAVAVEAPVTPGAVRRPDPLRQTRKG